MVELTHDSRPIIGRGPPLTAYFLTLAAISVGLMVADQRYNQIDRIRESLSRVIYPVQRAVDFPFRATDWVTGSFADRSRLRQENLELTARLRAVCEPKRRHRNRGGGLLGRWRHGSLSLALRKCQERPPMSSITGPSTEVCRCVLQNARLGR